jgi:hypothetical protein
LSPYYNTGHLPIQIYNHSEPTPNYHKNPTEINQFKALIEYSLDSNLTALTISCISLSPSTTFPHCTNLTQLLTLRQTAPTITFRLLCRLGLDYLNCGVLVEGVFKADISSSSKFEESLSRKLDRSESKLPFLLERSSRDEVFRN